MRLNAYEKRRLSMLKIMENHLVKITNKVKYILGVLHDNIDLRKKKIDEIHKMLKDFGLVELEDSYHYLIKLPMDSVSTENVSKLMNEENDIKTQYDELKTMTSEKMWIRELKAL